VKATKETLSPTRVKITVEVPFDELKPSVDAAYRKIGKQVRVAGFRPGKVPPRILDQRVGRGVILEEAIQSALPGLVTQAFETQQVVALSQPELGLETLADGSPLVFTAVVDVRPEIVLPSLEGMEVVVDPVEVGDEQIDGQLAVLQDRFAQLEPVDRPVQTGDYVTLDMTATLDGEAVEDAEANGMSYEVGGARPLVPGLDEALLGAVEGERRTFDAETRPGDETGKTVVVTVTVRGVKEKKRPELDDDFAMTASELDTLAELRADIGARLESERRAEQAQQAVERLLDQLVERAGVPAPESLVAGEVHAREHRIDKQLESVGMSREAYFRTVGKTDEQVRAEIRTHAERQIKAYLVLDAVVQAEKIEPSQEEILAQIAAGAERAGIGPEAYVEQLSRDDGQGLTAMVVQLTRDKALAALLDNARVTDTAGALVRLDAEAEAGAEADAEAGAEAESETAEADAGAETGETAEAEAAAAKTAPESG
jgi:trigger factor